MLTIVCWKWKPESGSKHLEKRTNFSIDHVNILRASVERNTSIPHRFVLVSDDWKGAHSSIQVVNIDRHFHQFSDLGGCYRRLRAFDFTTAVALFGDRFISMDLDVVVTGNLDSILGFSEDFKIWEDRYKRRTPYCGSLWGMKSGSREAVWLSFKEYTNTCLESARTRKFIGTDQAHISNCLWPRESTWTINDGVYNFNTKIRRSPKGYIKQDDGTIVAVDIPRASLPSDAKLVFFNGKFDPSQPSLQKSYPWIRDCWHE